MNELKPKMDIEARYRTMLILWFALMMSVAMYVLTTQLVGPQTDGQAAPADNRILSFAFAGIGTFAAIISFAVRSKFLRRSVEKQDPAFVQIALIAGCALCEVPALLGVVERFILPGRDYMVLLAISAISMAFHFPRRANLLAATWNQ